MFSMCYCPEKFSRKMSVLCASIYSSVTGLSQSYYPTNTNISCDNFVKGETVDRRVHNRFPRTSSWYILWNLFVEVIVVMSVEAS